MGIYKKLIIERVRFAIQAAKAARELEHRGIKGAVREVLIADLFRPLLPSEMGIASGVLISSFEDAQSTQQDIIIFHKGIISPLLFEQGPAIVPVESVLCCVEIKSLLNATEIGKAHEGAVSVRSLSKHAGFKNEQGEWVDGQSSGLPILLLALETDLAQDKSEWERYLKAIGDAYPEISGICVPERGYWCLAEQGVVFDVDAKKYFRKDHGRLQRTSAFILPTEDYMEVLRFLASVIEVCQRVREKRGMPPLSSYFYSSGLDLKKIKLASGESIGWYVVATDDWESKKLESRGLPLTFVEQPENAFQCNTKRAAEIQEELKNLGFESQLV
jgi:hypothetical protein